MILYRVSLAFLLCIVTYFSNAQESASKPTLNVSGEVTKPLALTVEDLIKMKSVNVNMKDKAGKEHRYRGVDLEEILMMAGVTMDKQLRGENLSKYLIVKCTDGYKILFSLAELDSSFTNHSITLAYESDSKPITDGTGPFRLVVPGEKKAARSARQVVSMIVKSAKE